MNMSYKYSLFFTFLVALGMSAPLRCMQGVPSKDAAARMQEEIGARRKAKEEKAKEEREAGSNGESSSVKGLRGLAREASKLFSDARKDVNRAWPKDTLMGDVSDAIVEAQLLKETVSEGISAAQALAGGALAAFGALASCQDPHGKMMEYKNMLMKFSADLNHAPLIVGGVSAALALFTLKDEIRDEVSSRFFSSTPAQFEDLSEKQKAIARKHAQDANKVGAYRNTRRGRGRRNSFRRMMTAEEAAQKLFVKSGKGLLKKVRLNSQYKLASR